MGKNYFSKQIQLLLLVLITFFGIKNHAQSVSITYPTAAQLITTCNGSSKLFVRLDITQVSTNGGNVSISLPTGVEYVSGSLSRIAGTVGVTITEDLTGVVDPKRPRFTINPLLLNIGNFIEFSINRTANCTSRSAALAGETFKDSITATVNNLTTTDNDPVLNSYQVNFPSISFTQPNAQNNATIGSTYVRNFTISNGANGCARDIHFSIDYPSNGISLISLTLNGNPVTPSSVVGTTSYFTISGATLTADQQLCNGESLVFTETYKLNTCGASTSYSSGWGCNPNPSQWCQTATGVALVTMAGGSPVFTTHSNTLVGYTNMCATSVLRSTFKNSGTGNTNAATMFDIVLRKGLVNQTASLGGYPSGLYNLSNAKIGGISIPSNLVFVSADTPNNGGDRSIFEVNVNNFFASDPDGIGVGLEDIDADGFYDDLPAGNTVTVDIDFSVNNILTCGQNISLNNLGGDVKYHTMCNATQITSASKEATGDALTYSKSALITNGYGPANIDINTPFTVRLSLSYFKLESNLNTLNTRYIYELTLPAGVTVAGTGNPKWINGYFPSTSAQIATTYSQVGNVIRITSPSNLFGYALIDLVYDCSTGSGIGVVNLSYKVLEINDITANCAINSDLSCGSISLSAYCPGTCTTGPITGIPVIRRADNSLGWTDATLSTRQTASNISAFDLSKALFLDTIEINGNARQTSPTSNLQLRLELDKNSAAENKLTPLNIDVIIKRGGVQIASGTVNTFSLTNSSATVQKIDWDLTSALPNSGLLANDEIITVSRYKVATNTLPRQDIQSGVAFYFYNNVGAFVDYCNSRIPEMYLVGTAFVNNNNVQNVSGCTQTVLGGSTNYIARRFDTPGAKYLNEFRPGLYITSIEATIPDGYTFTSASFSHLTSGSLPMTPSSINGNVYTFNNPGNWDPIEITVSNVYGGRIPFTVQASCGTLTSENITFKLNYKDFYYAYAGDVPQPNTYNAENIRTEAINYQNRPDITLTNQTGTIQASNITESWVVRMSNVGQSTAPFNWISIPNTAGVTITQMLDLASNTVIAPIAYNGGNIYNLNAAGIANGLFKDYRISFTYTNCNFTNLTIYGGWNCSDFPTDPDTYTCSKETLVLSFNPAISEIEIISVQQPSASINLCDSTLYQFDVNNAQVGNVVNSTFSLNVLPGMNINAFEVEYPKGSGNWSSVPFTTSGTIVTYNLFQHPNYPALQGIPGTVNALNNDQRKISVRFYMTTDCSFVSGSKFKFSTSANRLCGASALGSDIIIQSVKNDIIGATTNYSVVNNLVLSNGSFDSCSDLTFDCTSTIIGGSSVTGSTGTISFDIPEGYTFNTVTCTSSPNCPSLPVVTGNNVILRIPTGLSGGDVMNYTIQLTKNGISCGNNIIELKTQDIVYNIACASVPGGFCNSIQVETGNATYNYSINHPILELTSLNGSLNGNNYNVSLIVANTGTLNQLATNPIIVDYYCADTLGNPTGSILATQTFTSSVNAGNSITENFSFIATPCTPSSTIVGVLSTLNNCVCSISQSPVISLIIANDNTGISIDGAVGGTAYVNVLDNDTLNGNPVVASQVTTTFVSSTNPGITLSGVNVLVAAGTPAGNYSLTYQICENGNLTNCDTAIVSFCVTLAPSIGTITQPTCTVTTGSVELTGLPTGNWTINPGNIIGNTATTTISGLASGDYTFTVTNSVGCTSVASATATINTNPNVPTAPNIGAITNPTCSVATGSIELTGLPSGNWIINPGNITGNTATTTISGLASGDYTFTVTNSVGCTSVASAMATINTNPNVPTAPSIGAITNPTCTVATGSIELTGLPSGNWTINPGNITGNTATTTISGLASGDYMFTVTNSVGCTSVASATATINVNPNVPTAPSIGAITNPTCTLATGSIELTGLPIGNWTVNPGNITGNTATTTISGLALGDYTFTVTNSVGCTSLASATATINTNPNVPSAPSIGAITNPTCTLATGSIELTGLPLGNWTINPGNITGNTVTTSITGLASGDYTFTVTNSVGCTSVASATATINVNPNVPTAPSIGAITNPTCIVTTGFIELTGLPSGNWTINPGNITGNTATTTISGLASGDYTFTVTNSVGCISVASATATVNAIPVTLLLLANDNIGVVIDGAIGGIAYTNVLDNDTLNGNPIVASQVTTTFISSTNAGITLVGEDVVVTAGTANGSYELVYQICENTNLCNCKTAKVTVTVSSPTVFVIIANDNVGTSIDGTIGGTAYTNVLDNDTLNGNPVLASQVTTTFVSSTNSGITLSGVDVLVAAGTPTGSYTLIYQICENASLSNCDTAIVTIEVIQSPDCTLDIFNAISRDASPGINDFFYIKGIECYPNNTVEVYDRWGVKVFETNQYNNNDRRFNGDSDARATYSNSSGLPSGTYFYIIKIYDVDEKILIDKAGYLFIN